MKKFVLRVLLFFFIVTLVMLINYAFNSYYLHKKHIVTESKTVVIGDSRMMTGVDPELIISCTNTAQNSESYFISYFKLKYILKNSNGTQNVLLGFSYPSFSAYMDHIFKNDPATGDVLGRIYPIISLKDFGNIEVDTEKYNMIVFRNMFIFPHMNHEEFIGGYSPLTPEINKANVTSTIQRHYFDSEYNNIGISSINRAYLDSIVELTQKYNIELYLVNLPLHTAYLQRTPQNFIDFYDKTKKEMIAKGITVLDYGNDSMSDSIFKDHVHLSYNGASLISKRLNDVLK
jgi:hypothetical protein